MEYRILGRTGMRASVLGIGAGGASRLGKRDDALSEKESIDLVLQGLDAGINVIDTAEGYHTEEIVGAAVAQRDRSQIIISTKKSLGRENISREALVAGLQGSLRRLGTDYVDIYHLHGLRLEQYDYYFKEIVPALQDLKQRGLIRAIGVTEHWNGDLEHNMLQRALRDDVWDVVMVGFNLLNQGARDSVFRATIEKNIGVLVMFALRRALSRPERLLETLETLIERGEIDPKEIDMEKPLGFLIEDGAAASIPDAAYRFCRAEAGTHVILSGTGNSRHLADNLASFARPPLPAEHVRRLQHIFRKVSTVTGQ